MDSSGKMSTSLHDDSANMDEDYEAKRWTFEDINVLMDLWEKYYEDLKQKKSFHIYKEISCELQKRLAKDVPYCELEVHSKMQILKGQYQ